MSRFWMAPRQRRAAALADARLCAQSDAKGERRRAHICDMSDTRLTGKLSLAFA